MVSDANRVTVARVTIGRAMVDSSMARRFGTAGYDGVYEWGTRSGRKVSRQGP